MTRRLNHQPPYMQNKEHHRKHFFITEIEWEERP